MSLLINRGLVKDSREGIDYLNKVVSGHRKSGSFLSFRDFAKSPITSIQKLDQLSQKEQYPINLRAIRWHGILGHHLLAKLENQDPEMNDFENLQPSLFEVESSLKTVRKKGTIQYQFCLDNFNLSYANILLDSIKSFGESRRKELVGILEELKKLTGSPEIWLANFVRNEEILQELCKTLPSTFWPYILHLPKGADPLLRYLSSLTVQTWVRAWLNQDQFSPSVVLPEVSLLPFRAGLLGGKLDGLEIVKIRGRSPDKREREIIRNLYLSTKQKVVENILANLLERFGGDLEFKIIERKFAVGDGIAFKVISPEDVEFSPILSHEQQLKTYLVFFAIGRYLLDGSSLWGRETLQGQINYHLPWSGPVSHRIAMDKTAQEEFFKDTIVHNWHRGKLVSNLRGITNVVLRHMRSFEKDVRGREDRRQSLFSFSGSSPKEEPSDSHHSIARIIDSCREFLDSESKVFEVVSCKDGDAELLIHIEQLALALERHLVKSTYFRFPRGGLIACPLHEDKNPSLFVYLEHGHYHCFSCGRHGKLIGNSWAGNSLTFSGNKLPRKIKDIVIPQEQVEIMERVQYHLQRRFWGSPAEVYLRKVRRLDPKIAFAYGAGYDDGSLISLLLRDGYKWEDIEKYGFHLLRDRVTFPLKIFDKCSNFYGRHVFSRDKTRFHRKLRTPSVPTGAFNMDLLQDYPEKVIITEAVMEALTIIQGLGEKRVIAIIGTDSVASIDAITASVKDLGIALNNDIPGRENTVKIQERLRKHGFAGTIENFTVKFLEEHPEARAFKDFNQWWQSEKNKAL